MASESQNKSSNYHSLFWPVFLAALGLLWLFSNLEWIGAARVLGLIRLWPALIALAVLDLWFARTSARAGLLLGVAAILLMGILLVIGPRLGLARGLELTSAEYTEPTPVGSLHLSLERTIGPLTVTVLPADDSQNLFTARLHHIGQVEYESGGGEQREVMLRQQDVEFSYPLLHWLDQQSDLSWTVQLAPDVPLTLDVSAQIGETNLDLSQLQLTSLSVVGGLQALNIALPAPTEPYDVTVEAGWGEVDIALVNDAALDLDIYGGPGEVQISLPENVDEQIGVQVTVISSLDNISLPEAFHPTGVEGTWATANFAAAQRQITIRYIGGIGGLVIQ